MRGKVLISAAALVALATTAWAGELVTLRNGFAMQCDHHAEVEGHVRLYLSAGEDNYIEFAPREIAGLEPVADPPPPAIAKDPASGTPAPAPEPARDAKLSPEDLREMLSQAGGEHNLDVDLLASLVKAESGGNARAVSSAGARGLMQLMPGTAAELGVADSFKPDENVRGGSAYLDALLTRYHDKLALALAAYNAGPAAVDKYHGIPPYHETRAYVARVIHEFNRRVLAREAQAKQALASAVSAPDTQATR
ncbi:MAG TPA: lytic transglycosylase domain-containing protein [Terracidiphilus sp.]|nr:lytic transglycosylase domain-containing protein [Terracidiphilus sp.]